MAVYLVEEQLKRAAGVVNWMQKCLDENRILNEKLEEQFRQAKNSYLAAWRRGKKLEALAIGGALQKSETVLMGEMFIKIRQVWRNYNRFFEIADQDMEFDVVEPTPDGSEPQ